jgi:hypothetical protein
VNVLQSASPLQFVEVDAEVVDRNLIRLDTQNVLDVTLTPGAALVDAAQPIKAVWNGVAHDLRLANGALRLSDPGLRPGNLVKNASLPGGISDFTATPFAVVIGTTAKDPAMAQRFANLPPEKRAKFMERFGKTGNPPAGATAPAPASSPTATTTAPVASIAARTGRAPPACGSSTSAISTATASPTSSASARSICRS